MTELLQGLNAAQREAVTTTEGPVRVVAGAGSGKTRALTRRFAYLVQELGILPGNISCVTFTNKSAAEMRQRIRALTGDDDTGYINTFHGFCVAVLQEDSHAVRYPKSFLVLDNADIDAMLQLIYEERGLGLREMTFSAARDLIEIRKTQKEPEYYRDLIDLSLEALREKYLRAEATGDIVFYGYLYQQKKCFGLDYNDLILFTLHIFRTHEDICRKWQERLEYVMIDEFQDIDQLQYDLMEVLCGYHGNLFVVGDPDQTIYTWRGASVKFLMDFDKVFPGTRTVLMTENYRSTPQILAAANALIAKNGHRIAKELTATRPSGAPVLCHLAETQEAEAVLLEEKLPYVIYSGVQFYDRREIKDALSYLRMIAYQDDLSFRRVVNVPKRNLGKRRMAFLEEAAQARGCSLYQALRATLDDDVFKGTQARAFVNLIERAAAERQGQTVSEVLSAILDESGYERALRTEGSQERLDDLAELKQSVYEYETSCGEESGLEHYLAHVALFTNADTADRGDRVKLMTVHAAKGLEFPYVFLCGMDEGIFPSRKIRTLTGMEEERRLAFVAVTRAERGLYLSASGGRNFDGSPRWPSRFLLDIGPDHLTYTEEPDEGLIRDAAQYAARAALSLADDGDDRILPVGQRVRHALFGLGTVLDVDRDRGAHLVRFDELDTPRRISFRAKLERA